MSNNVQAWFGKSFFELHPLIQKLHNTGGSLTGKVELIFAQGIAGYFGRMLAKKLSIPVSQSIQSFSVAISQQDNGLQWTRCFDQKYSLTSLFLPVGTKDQGFWIETTGTFTLFLTVDIKDGGWYWRPLTVHYKNIPLPGWLFPKINAFKYVEAGSYRFFVGFSLPLLGQVFSYSGLLQPEFF